MAEQVRVVIDDEIGHTEDVLTVEDLPPALRAFARSRPGLRVVWETPGAMWDVTPVGHDDSATPDVVRVEWADADLRFAVRGMMANPGCDECGVGDAVVKLDGRYLCASGATSAGLVVPAELATLRICDECEQVIRSADPVSADHAESCSLHPRNVV